VAAGADGDFWATWLDGGVAHDRCDAMFAVE